MTDTYGNPRAFLQIIDEDSPAYNMEGQVKPIIPNEDLTNTAKNSTKKKLNITTSSKSRIIVRPQSGAARSPHTTAFSPNSRPFSGISVISAKSKYNLGSSQIDLKKSLVSDHPDKSLYENKSTHYLKEAKMKEAKQDHILTLTLNKARNEQDNDCLSKMREANEINQELGDNIAYRPYYDPDGAFRCHVYDFERLVAELTTKEFIREYKSLKQRYKQRLNLKTWEVLSEQKTMGANYYFSSAKITGVDYAADDNNERKDAAKKERQKELKTSLYETMKLTITLRNQLEKLERCGLAYDPQSLKY